MPAIRTAPDPVAVLPDSAHAAVFGAPGSGKTRLAIELVAERVEARGYTTDEVLVLCATRATATALRDELAVRLGVTTRGPLARTANSVAFQLVRAYTGAPVTLLTGAEHDQIVAELIEGGIRDGFGPAWPEPLTAEVRGLRGFRSELRDLMMRAVEHGVDAPALARLAEGAARPEWGAAAEFLAEYAEVKEQLRPTQFDSAELGAFAAAIVRRSGTDPAAAAALGTLGQLRLIVVDDAHEATEATAALLGAFAARGAAVVALGDPDVASNGFRGGRPELLGALESVLGAPVHRLDLPHVHRGTPAIRDVVRSVTAHIGTALRGTHRRAPLAGGGHETSAVLGIEAASHAAECQAVAAVLRERHLLDGVPWSSMAVVLRSGADVPAFERGLALADVPTAGDAVRAPLRDAPAAAALLAAAATALDREPLSADRAVEMLTGPIGGFDGVALRRLRLALRHQELAAGGIRTADELLVEALSAPGGFETIDAAVGRRAARLAKLLAEARRVATDGTVEEVLWAIWEGSGLAAEWGTNARGTGVLAEEANRSLDAVVALFAAATRFVEREPEAPAARFIDEMLSSELPEDSLAPRRSAESVLVTTPPTLIGREFDIVVVAGLQNGVWPNLRPRGTLLHPALLPRVVAAARAGAPLPGPESVAEARMSVRSDELRLFALAVSRARRQLVLSCTANDDEQPSALMGYAAERVRPRRRPLHLRGLVGALRRELVSGGDAEAASALALLAEEGVPGAHPDDWYGLLDPSTTAPLVDLDGDPDAVVAVSPSQIDRVEESPLGWFIDQVASPPSGIAASIGTLVHAVVEEAGTRADGDTSIETLWAAVEERWKELRFEAGWVAERERRGARRMAEGAAGYLANFHDDAKMLLGAEGRFTLVVDRVRLSGTIDRVEASPDGTTVIVDVKTGRTPPTAEQTSTHPQLAAYQLAARSGQVPSAGRLGGAKLVYLAKPSRGLPYTERVQQPFDDEAEAGFRDRLAAVARTMAAAEFEGPGELGFRSRFGTWLYRVHLVPAVSA
ncbi:UrvD/REP family ATP-dependent DNA helicase [Agromyces sp. Marseille-P2726]|uniref:UrvD/REP family ATP-dependent DNA helicase n=1 Tax=Agromyces sp. Marseille-P2726 TaxID=2709132 RepID=UPI00156E9223|nr:UrvD/REP family ATP-dependent DNA helicase [Agromyces sp. Marseille-P2726]